MPTDPSDSHDWQNDGDEPADETGPKGDENPDGGDERDPRDHPESDAPDGRESDDGTDSHDESEAQDERTDRSDGDDREADAAPDESKDTERRAPTSLGLGAGLDAFADLLRVLDPGHERRSDGRVESDRTTIDYGVNVGLGPGPGDRRDSGRPLGSRTRPKRRTGDDASGATGDYHVMTREADGEVVVVADLPCVEPDDLTVGFERGDETLVIAIDGEIVERISLPWPARTAESTLRNGVLEIHLRENR